MSRDLTMRETVLNPQAPLSGGAPLGAARLLALYAIGRELLEQREPADVVRTILKAIVEHLNPDHACILSVAEDGSYLPLAVHELELRGAQADWPLSHTVLRRVRGEGVALLAHDSQLDARFGAAESVQRLRIHSIMCVPLGRQPVRGLVYLDNRRRHPFTRDDLDFLTAASLYAALVLERAEEFVGARRALEASGERLALLQSELLRHEIVGRSPRLLEAYESLRRFARAGARVLLRGETGTGKELFARAYYADSGRAARPYVPVPIPALSPNLIESELFGHVRGAFTEATRDKKGRLELADSGVLFLDEVGDIEPSLQPKLLRFLDSGELFRVGDTQRRAVDALVVSATNRPLEQAAAEGRFRTDLLARLGHVVAIPPLRERPEDVPLLAEHFLAHYGRGRAPMRFAPESLELMQRHDWPLNVRELQQVVERAVCLVDRDVILPEDLPAELRRKAARATAAEAEAPPPAADAATLPPLRTVVEQAERQHILRALEAAKGNKRRAIDLLRISPETFYRRLEDFGLKKRSDE
jgi:transcriptional regulator with GAF, ATPase, and Fis domain